MSAMMKSAVANKAAVRVAQPSATNMMVWQPMNNKHYLPPLTDNEISRQVDYLVNNGFIPCLEFADEKQAYVSSESCIRFGSQAANYYDNRYWTMWKLPMFGCTDPSMVLREIASCNRAFPNAYVRLTAFDNQRQVQIASFLVQRPRSATDYCPVDKRSVV
eukprot:gene13044-3580_t